MHSILLLAGSLLASGTAHAAGLDATFGSGGKLLPAVGASGTSQATGAILQADGKIVIVGSTPASVESFVQGISVPTVPDPSRDFLVLRLYSDGSLDSTFGSGGSGGKVTVNIPGDPNFPGSTLPLANTNFVLGYPPDIAYSVAVQSDGKLLVGGNTDQSGASPPAPAPWPTVTRLNADGTVDTSFGPTNTGTIVLRYYFGAGYSLLTEANGNFLVTTAQGPYEIDATGHTLTPVAAPFGGAPLLYGVYAVTVQPDGEVLFGGAKNVDQPDGSTQLRWLVTRTQAPKVPDATFGTAGSAIGPDGFYEQFLTSMALDSHGNHYHPH